MVAEVLSRIGDKWTVYVVRLLSDGSMRFNEIKRAIPAISQRMLTLTLRGLERDGLVTRTIYLTIPPRVDYELTDLGRTLIATLMALGDWALSNRANVEKARAAFDAKEKKSKAKIGLVPLAWSRRQVAP
jgi:DNA-binding HxlR family transcriptional regulator